MNFSLDRLDREYFSSLPSLSVPLATETPGGHTAKDVM